LICPRDELGHHDVVAARFGIGGRWDGDELEDSRGGAVDWEPGELVGESGKGIQGVDGLKGEDRHDQFGFHVERKDETCETDFENKRDSFGLVPNSVDGVSDHLADS